MGQRSAYLANDQGRNLVDARIAAGLPMASVEGGCFCCRYDDLEANLMRMAAWPVDAVFCEAVGSCTDVVATVVHPLERAALHSVGQVTAVIDPQTLAHGLGVPDPDGDVEYLMHKQIEEADILLLNRRSGSSEALVERARAVAVGINPAANVLVVDAATGEGIETWLQNLMESHGPARPALDIDYDRYAAAEAAMAWLNATCAVAPGSGEGFASSLLQRLISHPALKGRIVHAKATFTGATEEWAAVTATQSTPRVVSLGSGTGAQVLTLNLRAVAQPQATEAAVRQELDRGQTDGTLTGPVVLDCFAPAYPVPQHRL